MPAGNDTATPDFHRSRSYISRPLTLTNYKIDGEWHTWIDYEKFQDLVAKGETFEAKDYVRKTPKWSVFGAKEGGFDPNQTRVRKVRNHPNKRV